MMTRVCGARGFKRRTHSTPLMPGRLMSINTTLGFSCGRACSAASAVAYWLRHSNPSARLITRARVPRNCSLSSTMDTVMAMIVLALTDGHGQPDERAAARGRPDGKTAADILHPPLHVAQSISGLRGRSE